MVSLKELIDEKVIKMGGLIIKSFKFGYFGKNKSG